MTEPVIHVRPALQLRRPFARWATAQTPKIQTVGPATFAVPAPLFTQVPEWVLKGATVDGQPYVSPETSPPRPAQAPTRQPRTTQPSSNRPAARGFPRPDAGTTALAGHEGAPARATPPGGGQTDSGDGPPPGTSGSGVFSAPRDVAPDDPVFSTPEAPEALEASEPPEQVEKEPGDPEHGGESLVDSADQPYVCGECGREFSSDRGRNMHRRRVHQDG